MPANNPASMTRKWHRSKNYSKPPGHCWHLSWPSPTHIALLAEKLSSLFFGHRGRQSTCKDSKRWRRNHFPQPLFCGAAEVCPVKWIDHVNLNDRCVEGMRHRTCHRVMQYHPKPRLAHTRGAIISHSSLNDERSRQAVPAKLKPTPPLTWKLCCFAAGV